MSDNYPANPVTIGEHIKKTRMEKGLLQEDVAKLFGVSTDTITNWENERGIPQIQFFPKIIAFLGYHPFLAEPKTLGERIKRYRELHGLSHKKMGKLVGVDGSTICSWESKMTKFSDNTLKKLSLIL